MDTGLKSRVAVITGASKGIGKEIAKVLAKEGVATVMTARNADDLAAAARDIERLGGTALAIAGDATDPACAARVIEETVKSFSRLDILVNNVGGVQRFAGFLHLSDREWTDAFDLNVMSMIYFVRQAIPVLKKSPAPRIITISSISGIQPGTFNPHYSLTKAAAINLSKYLANQYAPDRILVNTVCPGPVFSEGWNKNVEHAAATRSLSYDEARSAVEMEETNKIPLGRIGSGEDVADTVAFLASDRAAWITGSCFHVNGGKLSTIL